ncbi:hypothetical protein [Methanotorris formicicus]|uniref:Lipoprotein n=1 Tax=Methanotorris formicicus Mc-S-70 TaxID=647171 RepID=H1KZS9_9EURY|nr:hypothetical protein [Methanotorris formicicus]EHP85626.1 hypothetical protein MetfoDRAFT_1302 [Methanotorris formicicus Mc-S-70]
MKKILCFFVLLVVVSFCGCFEENKLKTVNTENNSNNLNETGEDVFILNETNENNSKIENITINKTCNFSKINATKCLSIDDMFLKLDYVNQINASNSNGVRIIKIYKTNNITVVFDVSEYEVNFYGAMRYNKVRKYVLRDKFGNYRCYEFIPYYKNGSESYCYVRKIGKYWVIMGFNKKDKKVYELWEKWNGYIYKKL